MNGTASSRTGPLALIFLLPLGLAICLAVAPSACAQAPTASAEQGGKSANAPDRTPPPASETKAPVQDGERLSFEQSKVAAEMAELEDRMFRLSEALKEVEPENSSRLMLALKNAREELILHQMKQTQELLSKVELGNALTEEKQLLAKLQRLHDLLLSMDLDFQMRLEQLRLVRELLRQLDRAIQEEDREQKLSRDAADAEKALARLKQHRATLEQLIRKQKAHIEQGSKLAQLSARNETPQGAVSKLAGEQDRTRRDTQALAGSETSDEAASENLNDAQEQMGDAHQSLDKDEPAQALPHQKSALQSLQKELGRTLEELKRREDKLARERFAEMRKDQESNRQATDGIAQSARKLGDKGASAAGELIRAGGSMSSAEDSLEALRPDPASTHQDKALESLRYARNELAQREQELLEGLRGEVKRRVLEALALMLEKQTGVRESTETLGPRVADGSREALASVAGLAKSEGRIIELANETIGMVEETEFGIALPAALRVVRRSMTGVQASLGKGDASAAVVSAEQEIESDLRALLDAMKQLPASRSPSDRNSPGGPQDRERELNRLVAELKMLRLLQVRVNAETIEVDGRRPPDDASLAAAVRKAIAGVEEHQDDVRQATDRLAAERGQ